MYYVLYNFKVTLFCFDIVKILLLDNKTDSDNFFGSIINSIMTETTDWPFWAVVVLASPIFFLSVLMGIIYCVLLNLLFYSILLWMNNWLKFINMLFGTKLERFEWPVKCEHVCGWHD